MRMITDLTLENGGPNLIEPIRARLEQLKNEIAAEIVAKGLRASGRTEASMHVEQEGNALILYGREFFASLEQGSSPWDGHSGRKCTAEQFRGIIAQWISDKGLIVDNIKSASFLIARSIMQKGTLTYHNPREDIYTPAINRATEDIENQINLFYTQAIAETILKYKVP